MKKLFALLCVIAVLAALCIPAMAVEDMVPVVAQVPTEWTTPYLYTWNDAGSNAAWPGVPMQEIDGCYYAYVTADMPHAIVNNGDGQPQTQDLDVEAGLPICIEVSSDLSAKVLYELPVEVPAYEEVKVETYTIHAGVPAEWESAYVWAWDDNQTSAFSAWPGLEMTMGDDGFWTAEVATSFKNVVIAEKDGGAQTVDLTVSGSENWILLTEQNGEGKYEATVTDTAPEGYEPPVASDPVEDPVQTPSADNITVYAMVPYAWSDVRLWGWDDNQNNATDAGWPGDLVMTQGDDGWYSIEIPGWVNNMLINANGGGAQTGDQAVEAGKDVWLDCTDPLNVGIYYEKPDIEAPSEPVEPETTEPQTEPATTQPTDSGEETPEEEGNGGLIAGIVVAVIAVIAGAVIIFIILKKPE